MPPIPSLIGILLLAAVVVAAMRILSDRRLV
jgi:hypothetical protein